jgi:hypothetical protein
MAINITFRREDLIHPEDSARMTLRIEPAWDCGWEYSEHFGYREPAPHFHVIARGHDPDTLERIACIEL